MPANVRNPDAHAAVLIAQSGNESGWENMLGNIIGDAGNDWVGVENAKHRAQPAPVQTVPTHVTAAAPAANDDNKYLKYGLILTGVMVLLMIVAVFAKH